MDFVVMEEFLASVRQKTGVQLTLYANRGYILKMIGERSKGFRIANEVETVKDAIATARICKQAGIHLDTDVTGSDEVQTNASTLEIKSDFAENMAAFNETNDISILRNWLARQK